MGISWSYQKNACEKKMFQVFFGLKNDNKSLRSIEEKINVPGNSASDLILDGLIRDPFRGCW